MRLLTHYAADTGYLEDLLDRELAKEPLGAADRGLLKELTFGVVRWQDTLDWLIEQKTQGRKQKLMVQILLRLGLYQLFWLQRIPEHAAVHISVELAKQSGLAAQAKFINAILRAYVRERPETEKRLQELKLHNPSAGYSHPEWLYQRWLKRWGEEEVRQLLEWNNTPPFTYARLNTLKSDTAQLTARWTEEGVKFVPREFDWIGPGLVFALESHPPLSQLGSFQEGLFYIQDPSTLLAVVALAPQAEETVLDMCAAPGGKTTLMAQIMNNQGQIVAQDPYSVRRDLVHENCVRLGVQNVALTNPEASPSPKPEHGYDRVLIDVPCSNTGVMRRRVDLRWRLRPEELGRLQKTQLDLLSKGANQVRPGGTLVYSTCSLEPEENQEVVNKFLERNTNFVLEFERSLVPFKDGVDGAYVARLRLT